MRLQSGTLCRPSLGFLFFQGSGGCCLPQGSFQRPGGKLGPGGLGRDGSQEASAGPGKVSAWRERKQVAEASPAPCLETFPGVCSRQCPWDSGPGLQGREGHRGLQQALQLTGGPGELEPGPCQGSGYHVSHFQMRWNLLRAQTAAFVAWTLAAGHPHYYPAFLPLSSLSRPPSDHNERQETQTQIELIAPCYLPSLFPESLPSPSRNPEWSCRHHKNDFVPIRKMCLFLKALYCQQPESYLNNYKCTMAGT